jgi:hypothetical protein
LGDRGSNRRHLPARVFVLGLRALVDVPSIAIASATFVLITKFKKLPEPLVIAAAAVVGFVPGSMKRWSSSQLSPK